MALACRLLRGRPLVPSCCSAFLQNVRSISMSIQRRQIDEAVEQLKSKNPYYEKYAKKLTAMQEKAPDEFLDKVSKVIDPPKTEKKAEKPRDYSELLNPKPELTKKPTTTADGEIPHKRLSDIMKLDLVEDKTADEIKLIWVDYHKDKDVLIATVPVDKYELQLARGKKHPMFIVPLPRSEGFEFFLFQFAANTVHFTPLLCYQVHKENAPECLNIVYYTELRDKGLILMRAEYDKNVISAQDAQCLVNQLQLYYAQNNASKLSILEKFTSKPAEFQHTDVIKELENLSLV